MKKGIRPGTEMRHKLLGLFLEKSTPERIMVEILRPMRGKSEEEKERIAAGIIRTIEDNYEQVIADLLRREKIGMKLVWDKMPCADNGRNSEGSFIRLPDGAILFAYSRYNSDDYEDGGNCDIAAIYSYDEGETWSQPKIIVRAAQFGVGNIMSVSCVYQQEGTVGVYFLIKENEGNITFGRALSGDGFDFTAERCKINGPISYYVVNNDRFLRLSDGRLAAPAAMHAYAGRNASESFGISTVLISEDDGRTFTTLPVRLTLPALDKNGVGMQEPGIFEHADGTVRLWARTKAGCQYESYSRDGMRSFTAPAPSVFTSPDSPLEMAAHDGVLYAVYNPVPRDNYRVTTKAGWGRTPFVIRKSTDDGRTWGLVNVIEDDPQRGYCYPALFFTKDNAVLCAYCRGGAEDTICLNRLGIMKIALEEIG